MVTEGGPAPDKRDFFISRNKADAEWATWIAWQLEANGYSTFLQDWDFRPGHNFVLKMQEAAANCERTIAVLSPDYFVAEYSAAEWAARLAEDPSGKEAGLVTVRVKECDPPGLLKAISYIDFVGLDEQQAEAVLLDGVKSGRTKPDTAPGFPAQAKTGAPTPAFPGGLPPIWNVPHRRNPNFTGREELLTQLREQLASGEFAALTQAISGLGGVGKTQFATEYVYRHASAYEAIWWVRCEEPAQLASDFAGLAVAVGAADAQQADQEAQISAAKSWLDHNGGWLLILDNAPNLKEVEAYLPNTGSGHVIITSRDPKWGSVASPLSVETWPRDESVAFLLKRTGQADEDAADTLAEELGDLPLALNQAAAYVEATTLSIQDYLETFREQQKELMEKGAESSDYPFSVATTWEMVFEQLEANPAAVELLNLCAFLAPDDVPLEVIRAGAEHLPEALATAAADDLGWNDVLAALRRYSLVEVSGDRLSLHRLVQTVVRARLDEDHNRTSAEAAVTILRRAFPPDSNFPETWPACARLAPHALAAAGHAEGLNVSPEVTAILLNKLGGYLRGRAELNAAHGTRVRALRIAEAAFGPDHQNVAVFVSDLGSVLQDKGDFSGAQAHFERALKIAEKVLSSNHPHLADYSNNLGLVLKLQGEMAGARENCERALKIYEANHGPDHPSVATSVSNIGGVLRDQGDLIGAREHFERALKIDETNYGPGHSKVAIDLNNLGTVLYNHGDLTGARALFERALKIDEATWGQDHPSVALRLINVGAVLISQGDLAGARSLFERALDIRRRFLGDDHPDTVAAQENLDSLKD